MWALSYPGRIYQLPDAETNFALIAETLLDLETSYYTPNSHLKSAFAQTGAKALSTGRAAYHFYTSLGESELGDIREASIGTMLYPDDGATLIISCKFGSGTQVVFPTAASMVSRHCRLMFRSFLGDSRNGLSFSAGMGCVFRGW